MRNETNEPRPVEQGEQKDENSYIAIPINSKSIVTGYYFDANKNTFQVIERAGERPEQGGEKAGKVYSYCFRERDARNWFNDQPESNNDVIGYSDVQDLLHRYYLYTFDYYKSYLPDQRSSLPSKVETDAVGFAEWLGENYRYLPSSKKWYDRDLEKTNVSESDFNTTDQLYTEYLKQQK